MNTKALRQKILDLAIHGKLVPQDPNDEPASVLLERIKAEKERLIKEGKIKRTKRSKAACDKPHYPYELPEGWAWTTLSEITSIIGDGLHGTPQYDLSGSYYFINGNNLANRKIVIKEETKRISYDEYIKYRKPLTESTILVSINGTIGNVGTYNGEKVILGKSACFFNLLPFLFKEYICRIIESDYFRKYALKSATGSTIKNVPLKAINDFYVPIAPLQEQMRIVGSIKHWLLLVDSIEDNKENLQETIKQTKTKILDLAIHGKLVPQDPTDEPASELLKRINPKAEITCDNPQYGKLPKGWCLIQGKSLYKPMKSMKPKDSVFNYIDIDSIDNAKQSIDSVKVVKTENAPSRASRYTQKGDIVFSMVRPYLKNIAIVPANDCIASTGFYVCSPSNVAISKYCYYLMISDYTVSGLNQFMKGDNSPSINRGDIDNWLFPLPPLSEQHRIVAKIEELFAQLDNITSSL